MKYALIKLAPREWNSRDIWTIASLAEDGVWECVAPGMDERAARLAIGALQPGTVAGDICGDGQAG